MANTLELGNGKWATGKDTVLAFNDENNNFKPLPFSFSRASSGTVVNKDGLIETVGSGEPRIDFKDNTKGALLLEPERRNVLLQSNQFDTTWAKASSTIESGKSGVGGSANAWKLTTSSDFGYLVQTIGVSGTKTFSIYAKSDTTDGIVLRLIGGSNPYVFWSLVDGSYVGSGGGADLIDRKSTSIGNGWFRLDMTTTVNCTSVRVYNGDSDGNFASGSIYIQYAQLEVGSYATSYIPTFGSAVTRVADKCINAGNNSVINSTQGTIYGEQKSLETNFTYNYFVSVSDGTNNNRLEIRQSATGLQFLWRVGGAYQNQIVLANAPFTSVIKFALRYSSANIKFYVNGSLVSTLNSPTLYASDVLNNIEFADGSGGNIFRGTVKDLKYYNTALTDQELIALTTI
jgi:hypothetical protein